MNESNFLFFRKMGLYIAPEAFSTDLCARIRDEMQRGSVQRAKVLRRDGERVVDRSERRTKSVVVSSKTVELCKKRLFSQMPKVAQHFGIKLTSCSVPQYLLYEQGDFFGAHTDNTNSRSAPDFVKMRKVTSVVFLNKEMAEPAMGTYCGGALTLFGLIDKQGLQNQGFSIAGEPGLLVAFRSEICHEVGCVTHGERYSIVSWYQ